MTFYVRLASDRLGVAGSVRGAVRNLDPNMPIYDMRTMEAQVGSSLVLERVVAALASAFGLVATLLAMLGLYGVMSYGVARRTREIGIRIALGAERGRVLCMIMREVALLAATGIALGVPAALALTRYVRAQLFGLSPFDPLTFTATIVMLTLVALAAGYVPARRATLVSPTHALRYE